MDDNELKMEVIIMIVYANQKVITVMKTPHTKESTFLQVDNSAWQTAANNLSFSAFKIYLYFVSNKSGYKFALSYEAINELIPMKRDTYNKAIQDLKSNGYLVQKQGNEYTFYDMN